MCSVLCVIGLFGVLLFDLPIGDFLLTRCRMQSGSRFHAYEQKKDSFLVLHSALSRVVQLQDIARPDELKNVCIYVMFFD